MNQEKVKNIYLVEHISSDHFIPHVTVNLQAIIRGHMLIQRYQNMIEKLYCEPNDEMIMDCLLENVNSND